MVKKRLIPVLLLRNGWLVQSKGFGNYQNLGNPFWAVKRLSEWASDELIYLDISRDEVYDINRDDLAHPNRKSFLEIIQDVSKVAFMPIAVGGKIKTLNDIEQRLSCGADKVIINTQAIKDIHFVNSAAKEFGSQCVVVSIDSKLVGGQHFVFSHGGSVDTKMDVAFWAKKLADNGAGEIFLNSIDRDGFRTGYDIALLKLVSDNVKIPVIACGGVGEWAHFAEALQETEVSAVAAANIFHYVDQSVYLAKKFLFDNGFNVRPPDFLTIN